MDIISISFLATAATLYGYRVLGEPYEVEGEIHLADENMILAPLGAIIAQYIGTPCLICVNTWVCFFVALAFFFFQDLPLLHSFFVAPVGYLWFLGYQKYLS